MRDSLVGRASILVREAKWIGDVLATISGDAEKPLTVLNLGSASGEFRNVVQPYVQRYVFAPLERSMAQVTHVDIFPAEGVDVVADLADYGSISTLGAYEYDVVLLSNVLEHVTDIDLVATNVQSIILPATHLIVSGPRRYPLHPDPIDNGFRPDVEEIVGLFPELRLVQHQTVKHFSTGSATSLGGKALWRGLENVVSRVLRGAESGRIPNKALFGRMGVEAFGAHFVRD